MTDPRLERLRRIDEAAEQAPWESEDEDVWDTLGAPVPNGTNDAVLIATARNILPATINLLDLMLAHDEWISASRPCPQCRDAALAVLDRIGDDDG